VGKGYEEKHKFFALKTVTMSYYMLHIFVRLVMELSTERQ